jgi:hypothetical protein
MNGNFCTVEMMIFFPSAMNLRRSPERSAWPDRRAHLGELLDGVLDLLVEDPAVGDDDDRVEDRRLVLLEPDELVREPRDGVRLAAARRVLDQVAPARAVRGASASSRRTTSSWWKRGQICTAFFLPVFSSLTSTTCA